MTPQQVAKLAGCGVRHVRYHIEKGCLRGKARKRPLVNYRWEIDDKAAKEFIKSYKTKKKERAK